MLSSNSLHAAKSPSRQEKSKTLGRWFCPEIADFLALNFCNPSAIENPSKTLDEFHQLTQMKSAIEVLKNSVTIISNPEWNDEADRGRDAPQNISYWEVVNSGLQTLSVSSAKDKIEGLLYVPDLDSADVCKNLSVPYVPKNVTRQANLPHTDYNLIALAPWFNSTCSLSYLESAAKDPIRALLFYVPNTTTVPDVHSSVWNMHDGGSWKDHMHYPVYALPGTLGARMMLELALYSGNVTDVPYGHDLIELNVDPRDYVRVMTKIYTSEGSTSLDIWVFLLIVVGSLLLCIIASFITLWFIQRNRREALRRRVLAGDVDLEASGIQRLTVPQELIEKMPLFVYQVDDEDDGSATPNPHDTEPTDHDRTDPNPTEQTGHDRPDLQSPQPTHPASREPLSPVEPLSNVQSTIPEGVAHETSAVGLLGSATEDLADRHKSIISSQVTCPICLEDFEYGITVVRELPCHHIYHAECIDAVLSCDSSLCPLCKQSVLPLGYCPTRITNSMVRRERMIRRLRSRVTLNEDGTSTDWLTWRGRARDLVTRITDHWTLSRSPSPTAPAVVTLQMQPHLIEPQRVVLPAR